MTEQMGKHENLIFFFKTDFLFFFFGCGGVYRWIFLRKDENSQSQKGLYQPAQSGMHCRIFFPESVRKCTAYVTLWTAEGKTQQEITLFFMSTELDGEVHDGKANKENRGNLV